MDLKAALIFLRVILTVFVLFFLVCEYMLMLVVAEESTGPLDGNVHLHVFTHKISQCHCTRTVLLHVLWCDF